MQAHKASRCVEGENDVERALLEGAGYAGDVVSRLYGEGDRISFLEGSLLGEQRIPNLAEFFGRNGAGRSLAESRINFDELSGSEFVYRVAAERCEVERRGCRLLLLCCGNERSDRKHETQRGKREE